MFWVTVTLNNHIVNVDFHLFAYKVLKDFIDESLIRGPGVLKSKRHDIVIEQAAVSYKGGILFVIWVQGNLMIPRKIIPETQHVISGHGVGEFVNLGEWITILWADFM